MHPRYYISPSQIRLWKKSPAEYIAKYIHDKQQFVTKEMRFGSRMATALENDEMTGDPVLDMVMHLLPKYECMDHVTEVAMKIDKKSEPIILYGRMDTRTKDHTAFNEFKSGKDGKGGWTQAKVDADSQITFYATQCYLITGKIPTNIKLVWAVTEDEVDADGNKTGKIVCTGEIREFTTQRTMSHIINQMAEIRRIWKEIGEACAKELL